jgi:hypothetical protein
MKQLRWTTRITISELWTDYWKSAKERTSSASEILHFGVFKVGGHHPLIAEFDYRMTNAAMQIGFSPKLCQMTIDVMLTKKEGVALVEKLRTMILFMADYNLMMYIELRIGDTINCC